MLGRIIIDIILGLSGIYLIYAAFYLKKGFLEKTVALREHAAVPKEGNIKGFIRVMFPVTLVTGMLGILATLVKTLGDVFGLLKELPEFLVLFYFMGIVTYGFISVQMRNKYLVIEKE